MQSMVDQLLSISTDQLIIQYITAPEYSATNILTKRLVSLYFFIFKVLYYILICKIFCTLLHRGDKEALKFVKKNKESFVYLAIKHGREVFGNE